MVLCRFQKAYPMRRTCLPLLTCLLLSACQDTSDPPGRPAGAATAAARTPVQRVTASMQAFQDARSFHAEMTLEGAHQTTTVLDFVAPDRYRVQMPIGTQVIIGNVLYLQSQGRTRKMPLPEGAVAQWRDPMRLQAGQANLQVTAQGRTVVEGIQAEQFLVRNGAGQQPVQFFYWIGPDGLPLQLRHQGVSQGQPYTMTVRYSRFNDPAIVIDRPTASE